MPKLFFIIMCLLLISCAKELEYEEITHETRIAADVIDLSFIVSNFSHTPEMEKSIDRYACSLIDSLCFHYSHAILGFFKKSRTTNMKRLARFPDGIADSMDDDFLWQYGGNHEYVDKVKVKNVKNVKLFYPKVYCGDFVNGD